MEQSSVRNSLGLTYGERGSKSKNFILQRLFSLMENKKTNLAVSADVTLKSHLLKIANDLGPMICILKIHIDIIEDFDLDLIDKLVACSKKYNFLIFEDGKFCDIGNTVKLQIQGSIYKISTWADIVTAHSLPGEGVISAIREASLKTNRDIGVLLILAMSSSGSLTSDPNYMKKTVEMTVNNRDIVIGFISQDRNPVLNYHSDDPDIVIMTPGISFPEGKMEDNLGQNYRTPEDCILNSGTDVVIVGRSIIKSEDYIKTAEKYRNASWKAYEYRIESYKSLHKPPK